MSPPPCCQIGRLASKRLLISEPWLFTTNFVALLLPSVTTPSASVSNRETIAVCCSAPYSKLRLSWARTDLASAFGQIEGVLKTV